MRRYIIVTDYHHKNLDCSSLKEVFEIIKTLSCGIAFRISVYIYDDYSHEPFITGTTDIITGTMDLNIKYDVLFQEELYDL